MIPYAFLCVLQSRHGPGDRFGVSYVKRPLFISYFACLSVDDRVIILNQVEKLKQEKSEIQSKMKKEKNLGTQVQLNTRIKQIKSRIEAIKNEM